MVTIRTRGFAVCLLWLVLGGCSREQQDWRAAEGQDSIEAYGRFMERHPDSELVSQARMRVAQLGEDHDWQHAGSADTADAYRTFLSQHPNGRWAQEARIRIENFALSGQADGPVPEQAGSGERALPPRSAGPPAAIPPEVLPPPRGLAAAGEAAQPPGFGVQLGAFSTEAGADSQWRALSGRFGSELQGLHERIVPADTPSGRIYRLQADVGVEARARALCDLLRQQSQACVAVLPH